MAAPTANAQRLVLRRHELLRAAQLAKLHLGLVVGKVYEVVMFQAERNQCGSNFGVTLKNFGKPKSTCSSTCGDAIVAADERAISARREQRRVRRLQGRLHARPVLRRQDHQRHRAVRRRRELQRVRQHGERLRARLQGRAVLRRQHGRRGLRRNLRQGQRQLGDRIRAGACTAQCQPAAFCGDGVVNGSEDCDEGQNNGGPTSKCDTELQGQVRQRHARTPVEQCDKGTAGNTGAYGGCKSTCMLAPVLWRRRQASQ